jgi:hypothetical protein
MCLAKFTKLIHYVPSRIIRHRFSVGEHSRITRHYAMASCSIASNFNVSCRTIDDDSTLKQCRQFQGEVSTGTIILSNLPTPTVDRNIFSIN